MVLTKSELIASLQNEVRIVSHLAGKIDRANLDYRPTPKRRSTIELLKYLSMMGPTVVQYAMADTPDPGLWATAAQTAEARDFDQTLAAIAAQSTPTPRFWPMCPTPTCVRRFQALTAARPRVARSSSTSCCVGAPPTARSCFCTSRPAAARSWAR